MNDTQTRTAVVGPLDQPVGQLKEATDTVADALDDMAALGQHWARNRERGRMPGGIRAAMLLVARELLAHVDRQERELQERMNQLCGPAAYARNNSMCGNCGHPELCAAMGCKQPNTEVQRRTD